METVAMGRKLIVYSAIAPITVVGLIGALMQLKGKTWKS